MIAHAATATSANILAKHFFLDFSPQNQINVTVFLSWETDRFPQGHTNNSDWITAKCLGDYILGSIQLDCHRTHCTISRGCLFTFDSCDEMMPRMHITSDGTIENEGTGMLQVGTYQKQSSADKLWRLVFINHLFFFSHFYIYI